MELLAATPGRYQSPRLTQMAWNQAGLSLLEILITIVVLSLGLLGMAGLQITGLQNNRNAYYSTVATQQIQTMAELIRSDIANMRSGRYDNLTNCGNAGEGSDCEALCGAGVNMADCKPRQWFNNVSTILPSGQGRVSETANGSNAFYIAVRWADPQLAGFSGWGANTATDPATTACGNPVDDTNCLYIQFQP